MSGEQLAHPAARSMSLPFDALLSGDGSSLALAQEEPDAEERRVSRRFSSDPVAPSDARGGQTAYSTGSYHNARQDARPSRKERVRALSLWYDRMSNKSRVPDDDVDADDDDPDGGRLLLLGEKGRGAHPSWPYGMFAFRFLRTSALRWG